MLIIAIRCPAKYAQYDTAVKHHVADFLASAIHGPHGFSVVYDRYFTEPVCQLHGRTKGAGPVHTAKINRAVRQGLAVIRSQYNLNHEVAA